MITTRFLLKYVVLCQAACLLCAEVLRATQLDLSPYQQRVFVCEELLTSVNNTCVCVPGYHAGAEGCLRCPSHTYKDNAGNYTCRSCPPNSSSFPGADSVTGCLCDQGYTNSTTTGGGCDACPTDTYKSFTGNHTCMSCPAFSVSAAGATSATQCVCKAGYTGVIGAEGGECTACAINTYKLQVGSEACSDCPSNTEALGTGSSQLADCVCSPGFTRIDDTCTPCSSNLYKNITGDDACVACPEHSTSDAGSTSVDACECQAGYARGSGAAFCVPCEAGHYCTGSNSKQLCMQHSTAPAGSKALTDCVCVSTYFEFNQVCQTCTAGYYCPGDGQRYACPSNSTSAMSSESESACVCYGGFEKSA